MFNPVNPEDALRYLAFEAGECRTRDASEMHVLLYPAVLRTFCLSPMDAAEARAWRFAFDQELRRLREPVLTGADFPNQ